MAVQGGVGREWAGGAVTVSRRAADQLRAGSVWVYRSDVVSERGLEGNESGAIVTVVDGRGIALGSGLHSSASKIAVRLVSREGGLDRAGYLKLLRERVRAAIELRSEIAPISEETDARRLIFSEADGLPGIVADQYGELIVVQLLVQGTARAEVREVLGESLPAAFGELSGTVWERGDARMRELEQMGEAPEGPLAGDGGCRSTVFRMNGLGYAFDLGAGQKTGAFLDQRLNYAAAAKHARGRALDVCTYQGGFALHLARVCDRVTGVDASRAALEVADGNLERNRAQTRGEVDWIEADAFDLLRELEASGERYGTVVLDPPAFAKSSRAAEGALRGYKELNLRAMKMLEPGGVLVTCSCSHHVSEEMFRGVVASAAADASRRVQLLESRGAAPDHPAILTLPETSYLKCLICRVS